MSVFVRSILVVALVSVCTPREAMSQTALGDGHRLDANSRVGSGGSNTRISTRFTRLGPAQPRTFSRAFDLRSDAAFRAHNIDNVGQRLVSESLYNNPWYWQNAGSLFTEMLTSGSGVASSSAAQLQGSYNPFFYDQWESPHGRMQLAMGHRLVGMPSPLDSDPAQPRPGEPGDLLQLPTGNATFLHDDRIGTMLRSGRDHWRRRSATGVVGNGMTPDAQPMRYTMSYLRGIGRIAGTASPQDIGMHDWDTSRVSADVAASRRLEPPGAAWQTRFELLAMADNRIEPTLMGASTPGLMRPVLQSVANRYDTVRPSPGSAEEALAALDRQYQRMRTAVIMSADQPLDELLIYLDEEAEDRALAEAQGTAGDGAQDTTDTTQRSPGLEPGMEEPLTLDDFGLILQHGQQVASLASGDQSRFDDLLAAGELALRDGEYMRAERRFNRALRFIPGHPLGTAGLINSQVGAGLYLSGALTLKSLLGFQPEMIDVQFADGLLPRQAELDRAISVITGRLQDNADLDRYGLILAWIGHQLDRPLLVENGLDAMDRSGRDPAFTALLRQVWTEPESEDDPEAGRERLDPVP